MLYRVAAVAVLCGLLASHGWPAKKCLLYSAKKVGIVDVGIKHITVF
jgi:hypothetical protein